MLRGKRIGVYTHSSVAADVLADLASFLGAEVISLGSSGEFVAIDTEAIDDGDRNTPCGLGAADIGSTPSCLPMAMATDLYSQTKQVR